MSNRDQYQRLRAMYVRQGRPPRSLAMLDSHLRPRMPHDPPFRNPSKQVGELHIVIRRPAVRTLPLGAE